MSLVLDSWFLALDKIIYLHQVTAFVVQWIECQIPVLMMGVRIPSSAH